MNIKKIENLYKKKLKLLKKYNKEYYINSKPSVLDTEYDDLKNEILSLEKHLILICGRYKGIDERVRFKLVTDEISVGDYVLSGGEIAAQILIDTIGRVLPSAIGDYQSAQDDSFSQDLLDHPHYTRPAEFRGMKVPEVLLSGHHQKIKQWRYQQSLDRTNQRRPDLAHIHTVGNVHEARTGDDETK